MHFEGSVRARLLQDPASTLEPVASALRSADLAMVNLETPVTGRGRPEPKRFTFRAPPSAFEALRAAGVDVVTVANNHGLDYGQVGLTDTLAAAQRGGVALVGAGRDEQAAFAPFRTTIAGQRIAVIGATQVLDSFAVDRWAAGPDKPGLASAKHEEQLLAAVRSARASSDTVVVYLHWGRELSACPTPDQRSLAQALVGAGADVVVGSHAHVLLGSGWAGSAYVDYGLGNFLFYAKGNGPTTSSGVLTLQVRGRAVTSARWSPARLSGGQTSMLSGAAAEAALRWHEAQRDCTGLAGGPPAG